MARTAAVIVVGNEVLSGKVRDENAHYLIGRLRELGVQLARIHIVPDEIDAIVEAVRGTYKKFDHVFSSGGIGPTHDDITVEAVAQALGVPVVRSEALVALIETHYRDRNPDGSLPPAAYRLAEIPEGARLISHAGIWYPAIAFDELYLLPGVPMLFRRQFEAIADRFRDAPFHLRQLFLGVGEVPIAAVLDAVVARNPGVSLGSYPRFEPECDHRVKLTVESRDAAAVDRAFADLKQSLPSGAILREA
jgi:molybdenum cofactor synthesis domain-containing protein